MWAHIHWHLYCTVLWKVTKSSGSFPSRVYVYLWPWLTLSWIMLNRQRQSRDSSCLFACNCRVMLIRCVRSIVGCLIHAWTMTWHNFGKATLTHTHTHTHTHTRTHTQKIQFKGHVQPKMKIQSFTHRPCRWIVKWSLAVHKAFLDLCSSIAFLYKV